jgi:hypothetical protein
LNRSITTLTTTFAGALSVGLLLSSMAQAAGNRTDTSHTALGSIARSGDEGGVAGGTPNGPDVITAFIGNPGGGDIAEYGTVSENGIMYAGFSAATISCNLGEADAIWLSGASNQHPVIAQNLYRLKDGRFEQIGQSWLKHGFCAADSCSPNCGSPCEPNGSCDWLGTHATDTYVATRNGQQTNCGPRYQVNAWTGSFPYPPANMGTTGNAAFKRLKVRVDDLNPTLNPGALNIIEAQYVCTDEQAINRYNNVSYRSVSVTGTTNPALATTGLTTTQKPAISAWRTNDSSVTLENIDVPSDGRMILGYKATDLGGGLWEYEYALYNMNSHRSAQSFDLPIADSIDLTNVGFHDVEYHTLDPYTGADWAVTRGAGIQSWACQTEAVNVNANAVRWGTLYNFRFTADAPPKCAVATINLFRAGSPASMTVNTVGPNTCLADVNGSGVTDIDDLLSVISAWGSCANTSACGCPADVAPVGGNNAVDIDDLLGVISGWGPCS